MSSTSTTWIRRSIVTVAMTALLVAGAAGAAFAGDGDGGSGGARCDDVAGRTAEIQRELDHLGQRIAGASAHTGKGGPSGTRRLAKLQHRKARAEQKLAQLQEACPS